ncbi:MAG: diguanylate cyclase [Cyanobacteria bacterium SID2]|nr:diguanylate cyclase [Cyanobacteria bacterium SID2]MBP0004785.1 diguanylate cyclase [Cyanobacteria bacterium SBC]
MDANLQALLSLPQLQYFVIDELWTICELSSGVQRFGELPEDVQVGNDARIAFPELVGLEEILEEILQGQRKVFVLKGVARFADDNAMFYTDLYLMQKNSSQGAPENRIVVLVKDSTDRMATARELGQVAKEYSMALTALESTKNYIDRILQTMKDVLFVVTQTGEVVTVNRSTKETLGYDEPDLLLQPITKVVLNPQLAETLDRTGKLSEQHLSGAFDCRAKNGTILNFEFSCAPFQPDSVGIEVFVCIGRDVTARKRLERQLSQQESCDRLLVQTIDRVRQSLSLPEILNAVVREVRQSLDLDRAFVVCIREGGVPEIEVESGELSLPSMLDCLTDRDPRKIHELSGASPLAVEDIEASDAIDEDCRQILRRAGVRSSLTINITTQSEKRMWGWLVLHSCHRIRRWEPWEIELLQRLSEQVSIAIDRVQLYDRLQAANSKLEWLALVDELTQIPNRRHFNHSFEREWRRAARERQPLALILCDIDEFKLYNDTYGHVAGDVCLQQVAEVLRHCLRRGGDLVARYGGEEFAVLLPNTDIMGAVEVARAMQGELQQRNIPHSTSRVTSSVTASFGIAGWVPSARSSSEDLLRATDWALYQAKKSGRDRYCLYPKPFWDANDLRRD